MLSEPDEAVVALATRVFGLARSGDTATLVQYVQAGVPVNLANDNGDTLVMLAAYHGHPDTVRALLAEGADPNRTNDKDRQFVSPTGRAGSPRRAAG